jgi:N-acyl-D-amino-acid deacylase
MRLAPHLALLLATHLAAQHALLLRGGKILDGTGAPAREASLAIGNDGRIAAIGDLAGATAERTIDVRGLVLAPGFIDVHAHADADAAKLGHAQNFVRMGVTTILTGNCGGSEVPLAPHFQKVEENGIAVNYGSLVGHGSVRSAVMKLARRKPTGEELDRMRELVRGAMQDGAFGIATGLIYVPGCYARTDELVELAKVVAGFGGLYVSHMRNENDKVLEAIDEALQIGEQAGVAVHLSHLKSSGKANWGKAGAIVAKIRAAREQGRRVTGDQYAYPASSTSLDVLFPDAELEIGRKAFAEKLKADEQFAARMREALHATRERAGFDDFSYCRIANAPRNEKLNGLTLKEVAAQRLGKDDADSQARVAIALYVESEGARIGMVYHSMDEQDLRTILREDYVAVASDAGIRGDDTGSRPHPRGSGNNPRVLGRYARDEKLLTLPDAVRKMTSLPAQTFGIAERGVLREGCFADVVAFDPNKVLDRATYQEPLLAPQGIPLVLVNGVPVVENGEPTGKRPGKVLRRQPPAKER